MGSCAEFKIKDYSLFYMNSYVNSSIMSLFTEDDRINSIEYDEYDPEYEYKHIIYQSDAKTIKTRLDIIGLNLKTLEHHFYDSKRYRLNDFDEEYEEIDKKSFSEFLNKFTFNDYLSALKEIYDNKIDFSGSTNWLNCEFIEKIKNEKPCIKYILEEAEYSDSRVDIDSRFYLRGFLEKLDNETKIFIDVSELINAGYYNEKDKIAEQSLYKKHKTIIFTEGKYDTFVIKHSMELLYPQYAKYFSFLDIELSNLELGASRIITYLKSFISAGIINRVIILFDNDTEGIYHKTECLKIKKNQNNFCIKTYPNIKIAENYPTICPTGIESLNVNGSACSIELYLCDEVLRENNRLIPIQWKSFNHKINKYQGSFSSKNKGNIQKSYKKIIDQCKKEKKCIKNYNFDSMKILLQSIFTAFDDKIIDR